MVVRKLWFAAAGSLHIISQRKNNYGRRPQWVVAKLPRDDRRISVLTCGDEMTATETKDIRAWMAIPENIGALHRALLETPAASLDLFNPYGRPPPFAGRLEMIGMGETRLYSMLQLKLK